MKQFIEIMYKKMYKIEVNGFAILSISVLILYGIAKFVVDIINLF